MEMLMQTQFWIAIPAIALLAKLILLQPAYLLVLQYGRQKLCSSQTGMLNLR